jgi:uncharacterized protein
VTLLLENSFEMEVEPAAAWDLLLDVPRIVPCIPGAELVETRSETDWVVRIQVRLGSMGLDFMNDVTLEERDDKARRVQLAVKGRDVAGRGMVTASVASTVTRVESGARVEMATELAIAGRMAQFGRGIVADVSASLVESFAQCLEGKLVSAKAAAHGAAAPAPPAAATAAPMSVFALMRAVLRRRLRRLRERLRISRR